MPARPAALLVTMVLGLLVASTVLAWRRGRHAAATMAATACVALVAVVVSMAGSPINSVGIAVHQFRWLWPVAPFASAAVATVLATVVRRDTVRGWVGAVATILVVVAAVAVMTDGRRPGISSAAALPSLPAAQELVSDLESLVGRGTVLFDASTLRFAEPFSGLVFAEMQDRGIPFAFEDESLVRQFGEGRRHGGSADLRLWQVEGRAARDVPAGAERVGYAEAPSGPVALFVEPIG
jgi:hypothetical protein